MRVFDFQISVAAVEDHDDLEGTVISAGGFDGDFSGGLVSDDALDGVVQPRTSTPQVVDMEVYRNGVRVERALIQGDLTVERDYDNVAQGWGISCPLTTPGGVFGSPFNCVGPALGRDELDFYGIYATPSGVYKIKLLSDGIVDNSSREASDQGLIENFSGVDRAGRFDGVKVTKQFPPGHGLYRGRVCREVMRAAGETRTNFEDGARMQKEIQLVDGEPIPTLAEILEVENRRFLWSSDGYVTNPQVGRIQSGESAAFSFEERDLLRIASVKLDSVANVITLVIANGTRQNTKGLCSKTWEKTTEFTFQATYARKTSAFLQDVDGTYSSVTPYPSEENVLTNKVETRRAYRCDTLVEEIVKVWAMARKEVPRHKWEGGDGTDPELDEGWRCLPVYTDDNDGVGGGPAYEDEAESLRLVSHSHTYNFYTAIGYHSSDVGAGGLVYLPKWDKVLYYPPNAHLSLFAEGATALPAYGQAQGSVTFHCRFGHLEGAIKESSSYAGYPLTPWNEIEPVLHQEIWGNGTGVNVTNADVSIHNWGFIVPSEATVYPPDYDAMIPWSISAKVFYGNDLQQLYREDDYQYEWVAPRGSLYYWNEGDSRSEQALSMALSKSVVKTYAASKNTHSETTQTTNFVTGDVVTNPINGLPGNLPAIERLDDVAANPDIYEDGEQAELAGAASRGDTEQIIVTVPFDFLLTCHMPREVVVEFPWAENEQELQQMAEALVAESAAMPVFFTLPANFLIREAMPVHLLYRPFEIDHDIRIKSVRWKRSPQQPILTEVEARLYAF